MEVLNDNLEIQIRLTLKEIYDALDSFPLTNIDLYSGKTGVVLFKLIYDLNFNEGKDFTKIENDILEILERSFASNVPTLCSGKAGIYWFLFYLVREEIIQQDDLSILVNDDERLMADTLTMLRSGNYDFLHGALGIAWYFLSRDNTDGLFIKEVLILLRSLVNTSIEGNAVPAYDFKEGRVEKDKINLGLAHGIISIIKFCLECFRKDIQPEVARSVAYLHIDYLLNNQNKDISYSYFPHWLVHDSDNFLKSRLAWCYGDLTIAYILWQSGNIFKRPELEILALNVVKHSCKRRILEDTGILDAGICHGSAGLALIYNKFFQITLDVEYKRTAKYWIEKTLEYRNHVEGPAGYKRFNPDVNSQYDDSLGILDGISGIGLVLVSYLNGDSDWDYCFMLNN